MANLTSTLTVRLIDAVTGPARAAARSILGIGTAVDKANAKNLTVGGTFQNARREASKAAKDIHTHVTRLSSGLSMPTGFATWFGARSVYDFEKTSNALQAVTMMTEEQREAVQKLARDLNALFPFTNAEIMKAAFELGRAGFKYEQIIGVLKDTLNLALAGDIDLQQSADIATNVLTGMRLPMETAEEAAESLRRVNDALSYAATNSNTDVRMLGETFKYVGPMAAAAGMDVEQVAAAAMIMANNGIRASEAGVALRSALVRLVRPTKAMMGALSNLNINLSDFVKGGKEVVAEDIARWLEPLGIDANPFLPQIEAALNDPKLKNNLPKLTKRLTEIIAGDGSVIDKVALAEAIGDALAIAGTEVDLVGFFEELKKKGATLKDITQIFDARQGARLITLLAANLLEKVEDVKQNAPGATDRMARIRMQGVVGDWAALVAATENFFLAIADAGVLKTATEIIKGLTEALNTLAKSSPKLLELGTYGVLLSAILGPLSLMIASVARAFLGLFRLLKAAGFGAAVAASAGVVGSGAAAGAGAAGAAAGAATKGGWLKKLGRGFGVFSVGLIAKELLDTLDPKGNLWGLTSGIDAWFERNFGFNPSKIGGGSASATEGAGASQLEDWLARQAEIDARLAQIEASTHPAMRDAPNPERDRLITERALIEGKIAEARKAGESTGEAFSEGLEIGMERAREIARREMQKIKQELEQTIQPVIRPRVDGATLRGVHADVGVE